MLNFTSNSNAQCNSQTGSQLQGANGSFSYQNMTCYGYVRTYLSGFHSGAWLPDPYGSYGADNSTIIGDATFGNEKTCDNDAVNVIYWDSQHVGIILSVNSNGLDIVSKAGASYGIYEGNLYYGSGGGNPHFYYSTGAGPTFSISSIKAAMVSCGSSNNVPICPGAPEAPCSVNSITATDVNNSNYSSFNSATSYSTYIKGANNCNSSINYTFTKNSGSGSLSNTYGYFTYVYLNVGQSISFSISSGGVTSGNYTFYRQFFAPDDATSLTQVVSDKLHKNINDVNSVLINNKTELELKDNGINLTEQKTKNNSNNFEIFPNPNNGILYLNTESESSTIKVSNLLGQSVFQSEKLIGKGVHALNISTLNNGIYYLSINSGINEILFSQKIVINKN